MRSGSTPDAYARLIAERNKAGHPCTPEQQAGPYAEECPRCGRRALHQHCAICMACGYDPEKDPDA